MKNIQAFELSVDRINRNRRHSFFCVIIVAVIAVLINAIMISYEKITYVKVKTEQLLNVSTENTYVVDWGMSMVDPENVVRIKQEINDISGVKGAGMFTYSYILVEEFADKEEFQDINLAVAMSESRVNQTGAGQQEWQKKLTNVLCVDNSISGLCSLNVASGSNDLSEASDDGSIPVLVGYNYRELLKIGDTFTNATNGEVYKIIGILEKGAKWLSDNEIGSSINYCTELDNYIVVGSSELLDGLFSSTGFIYIMDNDVNLNSNRIDSIIENYGYFAESKSIKQVLDESLKDEKSLLEKYSAILLFLGSIGILTLTSISMVSVLTAKRDMGILYSVGFTLKDLIKITIWENISKVITGSVLGYAFSFMYLYNKSADYEKQIVRDLEVSATPLLIFVVMVVISVISVILPICMLKKNGPSKLISNEEY